MTLTEGSVAPTLDVAMAMARANRAAIERVNEFPEPLVVGAMMGGILMVVTFQVVELGVTDELARQFIRVSGIDEASIETIMSRIERA